MELKKENIVVSSYLVGLHSFRKDHNYGNYKNNLINDIQSLLNSNFESIKIGGVDILKTGLLEDFEIRLTPSNIIYQDKLGFNEITSNAKEILNIWLKYSPNVRLSLIGLVTNFNVSVDKPNITNHYRLKEQYFKNFKIGDKIKGIDFRFNYSVNYKGYDYNVQLSLLEKDEKQYIYQGNIDFNETTENQISGLTKDSCDRIFNASKDYFEDAILKFINYTE